MRIHRSAAATGLALILLAPVALAQDGAPAPADARPAAAVSANRAAKPSTPVCPSSNAASATAPAMPPT